MVDMASILNSVDLIIEPLKDSRPLEELIQEIGNYMYRFKDKREI